MEFIRARREGKSALVISDAKPMTGGFWAGVAQASIIGLFALAFGAALSFARPILLPVVAAVIVGTTLAPLVKHGRRFGLSGPVSAVLLTLVMMAAVGVALTLLAGPLVEWIGRAPEIGAAIRQKLYLLDRPLSALHELREALSPSRGPTVTVESGQVAVVAPVLALLTPALAQMLVFLGTLVFYMSGQQELRRRAVALFSDREAKLRVLRITNDIERNLAGYLAVVTIINVALGVAVGLGAWLFGFPNPALFGLLAAILNYIPYVGAGVMAVVILGVGLVSFESLGHALSAPAAFIALTTLEGQFVTPAILGRRLTLNPLLVFLSLAFWTWLWGPIGTFLAVPLAIVALVSLNHLLPPPEGRLPE